MTVFYGASQEHSIAAPAGQQFNFINNGGFLFYDREPVAAKELNATRISKTSSEILNQIAQYQLIDPTEYARQSFSFKVPEVAAQENIVGYWDIFSPGNVSAEINPVIDGAIRSSKRGGNIIKFDLYEQTVVTLKQDLQEPELLHSHNLTIAFSVLSIAKDVSVTVRVVTNLGSFSVASVKASSFGKEGVVNVGVGKLEGTKSATLTIELTGPGGSSVGIAGVVVYLGSVPSGVAFAPSIGDLTIPSGTVVLMTGPICPQGYRAVQSSDPFMALGTAGFAALMGTGVAEMFSGSDTHDHNPANTKDASFKAVSAVHETDTPIPIVDQAAVHTPLFGTSQQNPGEKPVVALGVNHTHKLNTYMESVPPSFPVRFCRKI